MTTLLDKAKRISYGVGRRLLQHPSEVVLMGRLAFWVSVMSVAARYSSLPRALQMVAPKKSIRHSEFDPQSHQDLARALDLVLSADIWMFRPICWKRAAVLHRFLALKGVTTSIRFGVRTEGSGKINGHAWLEAEGTPILESKPPDYIVTYTFPSTEQFVPSVAFLP